MTSSPRLARLSLPAFALAALLLAGGPAAAAQVIYVDAAAGGTGTGASWTDAYTTLMPALATAADGDQVWVAAGSYAPAGPGGSTTATFTLPSGVALYGGFDGSEALLSQRDPAASPTILSGDLNGDDAPGQPTKGDNVDHVLSVTGASASTRVDGFTIRGGYATASSGSSATGAGLLVSGGAIIVANCTFDDCLATLGGAVTALGASVTVQDGAFTGNRAWSGRAGALYASSGSVLIVERCSFVGNTSFGGGGVGDGGAAFLELSTTCRFEECSFSFNNSSGVQPNYANGGAICSLSDDLTIVSCTFENNSAAVGGALGLFGDSSVANSLFTGNSSQTGGAVFNFYNVAAYTNCVIAKNTAGDGGGFTNGLNSQATLLNTIVWGNTSPGQPTYEAQVHNLTGGHATIQYSCVQALLETIPGEDPPNPANFPGSFDDDPLFANLAALDLHLAAGSPCIDAGKNGAVPSGVTTDLDGLARFTDDPSTPDTGLGTAPIVDMGCYEFGSSASPWSDLGFGLAGTGGVPVLTGSGTLVGGDPVTLTLAGALPGSAAHLVIGTTQVNLPLKGGVLVPAPSLTFLGLPIDGTGGLQLAGTWPPAFPSGLTTYYQCWVSDAGGPVGFAASNGLGATSP